MSVVNCDSSATFQLTPPIQRATPLTIVSPICKPYFNSRPLYRGRLNDTLSSKQNQIISTHAPYTEGDPKYMDRDCASMYFNSRPLYRGRQNIKAFFHGFIYFNSRPLYRGRLAFCLIVLPVCIFQLTPPIQRATAMFLLPLCQ